MSQKPYLWTREGWWVNKYDIDGDSRLYNSSENGEERLDRDGDRDRERDREK
jgi:hypothetical protein